MKLFKSNRNLAFAFMISNLLFSNVKADSTPLFYRVKKNDSVGQILNSLGVCPLWGPGQHVEKTLRLNHLPDDSAARRLPKGKLLYLPVSSLTISKTDYQIQSNEVILNFSEPRNYCKKGSALETIVETPSPPKAVAAATPAAIEVKSPQGTRAPSEEERARSSLGLALDFDYFGADTSDLSSATSSNVLSRLSPGARLYWKLFWNEDFETTAQVAFQRYSILPFDNFKNIQNADGSRLGVSLGARYRLSEKWAALGGLESHDEIFNRSTSTSDVTIEAINIPQASLGIEYRWLSYRGITLHQNLRGIFYLSRKTANYNVNSGFGAETNLTLSHALDAREQRHIFLNLEYRSRTQNTSIISNNEQNIGFSLGYEFPLQSDDEVKNK